MKLAPLVLINLVTVAIALIAYDVYRTEPEPQVDDTETAVYDASDLEDRLAALEADRRRPRLNEGSDPRVLARLAELEARLDATGPDAPVSEGPAPETEETPVVKAKRTATNPTPTEIKRFRAMLDAVRREDAAKKNAARVDAALDRLSIQLTDREREGVHKAFAAFQPRIDEIWTDVKVAAQETIANGGTVDRGELVAGTQAVIQREFAETLTDIIAPADIHAVAAVLLGK